MIKLDKLAQSQSSSSVPDLRTNSDTGGEGTVEKKTLTDAPSDVSGPRGDSDGKETREEDKPKSETFSNNNSSYSRFILKDGEPYLDAMPGVELDRDALISSAAEVIAQLDDPKKVDAFTKSVCRALKCATTDISRSANSKDDAVAAIAVAASSAPTFTKRSTLWKDDVKVEDEDGRDGAKRANTEPETHSAEDDDIYADQET